MRTVVSSILALALSASAQSVARLHLSQPHGSDIVKYDQVERIISDIVGVSSIRSEKVKAQETAYGAHLVVVANGISSDAFSSMNKVDVLPVEELKNYELVHKMLRNFDDLEENEVPASIADLFHQANPGSLHVSLSGNSHFLDAISLHGSLVPTSNAASILVKSNGVSVQNSQVSSVLKSVFGSKDIESVNREIFNNKLNSNSDQAFLSEFAAIKSFSDVVRGNQELSALVQDGVPDFFSVSVSSLNSLRSRYGANSEQYTIAASETEKLIEELKNSIESAYETPVSTSIISFENENENMPIIRSRRGIQKRTIYDVTSPCFDSEEACNNQTSSCNLQGNCTFIKSKGDVSCFKCKCKSEYTGESCEFEDHVSLFHTVFWTSLLLAIIVFLVSMTLAYTDPGTDTLLFRTGSQRPKTD